MLPEQSAPLRSVPPSIYAVPLKVEASVAMACPWSEFTNWECGSQLKRYLSFSAACGPTVGGFPQANQRVGAAESKKAASSRCKISQAHSFARRRGGCKRRWYAAGAEGARRPEGRLRGDGGSPSFPLCPATHEIPDSPRRLGLRAAMLLDDQVIRCQFRRNCTNSDAGKIGDHHARTVQFQAELHPLARIQSEEEA